VGFDLSSRNGDTHFTPRRGAEVIFNAVGSPVLGARLNCLLTGDDGGNYRFQRLLPHRVAFVFEAESEVSPPAFVSLDEVDGTRVREISGNRIRQCPVSTIQQIRNISIDQQCCDSDGR
jgi:hypothetical protein